MCGIIGIVSDQKKGAREALITGLERLEYRGYDSAGIALVDEATAVYKTAGRVKELRKAVPQGADAGTGIAHTRWATHGPPVEKNAHPHKDCRGRVVVVHNGIFENFAELKAELKGQGHRFVSDTDTEVFAHLLEEALAPHQTLTPEIAAEAFRACVRRLTGGYALVATVAGLPGVLFGARNAAPLLIGVAQGKTLLASDATAVVEHTKKVVYLDDGDMVIATPKGATVTDLSGKVLPRPVSEISWSIEEAQKGGFEHFMLKEIHDGPRAVREAVTGRVHATPPHVRLDWKLDPARLRGVRRVLIIAAGTSYHAGLVGKHLIESLVGLPVDVANASEYRYSPAVKEQVHLAVAVSQSGETADTIAAMREAKSRGHITVALTNVVGSTVAREAEAALYLQAGPEIGVAATKSFLSQVAVFVLLALHLAEVQGTLSGADLRAMSQKLQQVPRLLQQVLDRTGPIQDAARSIAKARSVFYLGRQAMFPVALEGALKIKEIAYLHAEGYAGGELKHGPFALLTKETPVVALLSPDHVHEKMVSNIIEVKARGSPVYIFTTESDKHADQYGDVVLRVPDADPLLLPLVQATALHLFAYWAAASLGCEIDKPRNLAKSVTVE